MNTSKMLRALLFWTVLSAGAIVFVKFSLHNESLWAHAMAMMLGLVIGAFAWLCALIWRRGTLDGTALVCAMLLASAAVPLRHIFAKIASASPWLVVGGAVAMFLVAVTTVRRAEQRTT